MTRLCNTIPLPYQERNFPRSTLEATSMTGAYQVSVRTGTNLTIQMTTPWLASTPTPASLSALHQSSSFQTEWLVFLPKGIATTQSLMLFPKCTVIIPPTSCAMQYRLRLHNLSVTPTFHLTTKCSISEILRFACTLSTKLCPE